MQKIIYKLIIMILIFILSAGYFISNIKETSYNDRTETTEMSAASFPTISMLRGDREINLLHGYGQELDNFGIRQEITPLENNKNIDFIINTYSNKIVRVEYEVKDKIDNIIISTGEVNSPEINEEGRQKVSIKLDTELSQGMDFLLKLRLVNEDGKKFIFFTTVKFVRGDKFTENYNFAEKFFNATLTKTDEKAIKPYLETNGSMDNADFAYVNIHSSYDLVTWGKIPLEILTKPVVTITENSDNISGIVYKYIAKTTGESPNYYSVREYYRINRFENTTYLLAYERKVEEIYNPEKTSVSKSQLKLGITGNPYSSHSLDKGNKFLAFERGRNLWYYETTENKLKRIFSFIGDDFSDERTYYDNHDIKVLRMEDSGDFYFIVYGYMNRGVYEGKTGIVLYKYLRTEDRIEEQAYIPVNLPAQFFEGGLSDFSFVSGEQFFYFSLYDKIYSYSLIKRKLSVMAENISGGSYLAISENNHVVWQETSDVTKVKKLIIMNLETRKRTEIEAEKGTVLGLLGKISGNFIYGVAYEKDIISGNDGNITIPYKKIVIANVNGESLKNYEKKNIYITGINIVNDTIELERVKKQADNFVRVKTDHILNNAIKQNSEVSVVDRRTDKYLTEYYMTLPYGLRLEKVPEVSGSTMNTVITRDLTIRLGEDGKESGGRYFVNISGEFSDSSYKASDMIKLADRYMGYVLDIAGNLVWERSRLSTSAEADDIDVDYIYEEDDSIHSAIRLFLTSKGIYISTEDLNKAGTVIDVLKSQQEIIPINLLGVDFNNIFYYIDKGNPVIAMKDNKTAVLITAYTPQNIEVMNVKTGRKSLMDKNEAEKIFKAAGNIFISALN